MISSRISTISDSVTLKLNDKALKLAEEGRTIYNLTTGQLPFKPAVELIDNLRSELNFLKSFQYSPVIGFPELRNKIINYMSETRVIDFNAIDEEFDCVVSNGGKHNIFNALLSIVDPDDEVVLISPFWLSYPEMITLCLGKTVMVGTSHFKGYTPSIDKIRDSFTEKTKVIIINSPNNPTGVHYNDDWMDAFADLMMDFPNIAIISDEIYFELNYFDPAPTYFYSHRPELLKRTVIATGISKALAAPGLRLGYCVAPKSICNAMSKVQSHTASGANSLVQRALSNYDYHLIEDNLRQVKTQLRSNSGIVREALREKDLANCWYQPLSAFYFMLDISVAPVFSKYKSNEDDISDYSEKICEDILESLGVALVPGNAFGMPNSARISMVLEKTPFTEAMKRLANFLTTI